MTDKKLLKSCELFYASHYFPLAVFDSKGKLIKSYSSYEKFSQVFDSNSDNALSVDTNPSIISGFSGLFGIIKINETEETLILGPYINKSLSDDVLNSIIRYSSLDWVEKDNLRNFLETIPKYTYNQFLNLLSYLHFLFNNEEVSITEHFKKTEEKYLSEIGEKQTKSIWDESQQFHGTYYFEQRILSYISSGDVEGITGFFDQVATTHTFTEGKLADNTLRQAKNLFIGLIAMVGKSGAIKGNLAVEETYQLIDLYTQECERCRTEDEVATLRYNAIIDFTRRVNDMKHPDSLSDEVFKALQFIKTHTNQPIGVMDVVEQVNRSRSAFLAQFKKETGETIGRNITKAKLQESKLLLAYSDKPLSEISNFFYFSSQAHFQNLFKKEFGITPLTYRKKKQHI